MTTPFSTSTRQPRPVRLVLRVLDAVIDSHVHDAHERVRLSSAIRAHCAGLESSVRAPDAIDTVHQLIHGIDASSPPPPAAVWRSVAESLLTSLVTELDHAYPVGGGFGAASTAASISLPLSTALAFTPNESPLFETWAPLDIPPPQLVMPPQHAAVMSPLRPTDADCAAAIDSGQSTTPATVAGNNEISFSFVPSPPSSNRTPSRGRHTLPPPRAASPPLRHRSTAPVRINASVDDRGPLQQLSIQRRLVSSHAPFIVVHTATAEADDCGGGGGRQVVIKTFLRPLTMPPDDAPAAMRKMEALRQLLSKHSHLMPIEDVIDDPAADRVHLVLPHVGEPLGHRNPNTGCITIDCPPAHRTLAALAAFGAQLADALMYLHDAGITHGNVTPTNVYVSSPNNAEAAVMLSEPAALVRLFPCGDVDSMRRTSDDNHTHDDDEDTAALGATLLTTYDEGRQQRNAAAPQSLYMDDVDEWPTETEEPSPPLPKPPSQGDHTPMMMVTHTGNPLAEEWLALLLAMTASDGSLRPSLAHCRARFTYLAQEAQRRGRTPPFIDKDDHPNIDGEPAAAACDERRLSGGRF